MNSFFKNKEAKSRALALYDEKLESLNIRYENLSLETGFGDTNIIVTGSKDKPPLVLLHGSNGCAPVAIEAMIDLVEDFRIYAVDVVGQPNLSAESRPDMKSNEYGQWMHEILTRLNIIDAVLVGISFGGFISWKTLIFDERRISKAFLIVPAGIVNGNPLKAIWKVFLPMKLYGLTKNRKYVHRFLSELFTEKDNFAVNFLSEVFLTYKMDFSPIPVIQKEEARKIKTPIFFIAAEHDVIFPGKKMLDRVRKIFTSLGETLFLKNSKHVPAAKANEQISNFIKTHTSKHT